MIDIFDSEEFNEKILHEFDNLREQLDSMVLLSNNSLQDYIRQAGPNSYDIAINIQTATEFIKSNFIALNKSVDIIYNSLGSSKGCLSDFNIFYDMVNSTVNTCADEHVSKTVKLACVCIVVLKNRCCNICKELHVLLNSMCKFPEVNLLMSVTENILSED